MLSNFKRKEVNIMKFIKGIIMGSALAAGGMMLYNEMSSSAKKRIIKKGKQFVKKMGIL